MLCNALPKKSVLRLGVAPLLFPVEQQPFCVSYIHLIDRQRLTTGWHGWMQASSLLEIFPRCLGCLVYYETCECHFVAYTRSLRMCVTNHACCVRKVCFFFFFRCQRSFSRVDGLAFVCFRHACMKKCGCSLRVGLTPLYCCLSGSDNHRQWRIFW